MVAGEPLTEPPPDNCGSMLAGLGRVMVRDTAPRSWKSSMTSHTTFNDGRKAEYEPFCVAATKWFGYRAPSGRSSDEAEVGPAFLGSTTLV